MQSKLAEYKRQSLDEVAKAGDLDGLEDLRVKWLGRKGALTEVLRGLSQVAPEERGAIGKAAK